MQNRQIAKLSFVRTAMDAHFGKIAMLSFVSALPESARGNTRSPEHSAGARLPSRPHAARSPQHYAEAAGIARGPKPAALRRSQPPRRDHAQPEARGIAPEPAPPTGPRAAQSPQHYAEDGPPPGPHAARSPRHCAGASHPDGTTRSPKPAVLRRSQPPAGTACGPKPAALRRSQPPRRDRARPKARNITQKTALRRDRLRPEASAVTDGRHKFGRPARINRNGPAACPPRTYASTPAVRTTRRNASFGRCRSSNSSGQLRRPRTGK